MKPTNPYFYNSQLSKLEQSQGYKSWQQGADAMEAYFLSVLDEAEHEVKLKLRTMTHDQVEEWIRED